MRVQVGPLTLYHQPEKKPFAIFSEPFGDTNCAGNRHGNHYIENITFTAVCAHFCMVVSGICRLRTHNQNMTVAARAIAERKTVGDLS